MSDNTTLSKTHNRNIELASGLSEILESMGTPEAGRMAAALREGADDAIAKVTASKAQSANRKSLMASFKQADERLKAAVTGTYAFIQGTDEKLYDKLPPEENWSEVAGGTQAQHLLNALEAAGKDGKPYIHPLEVVLKMRQKAEKDLVASGTVDDAVHSGDTAVVKLRMLIAQADLFIRGVAKPGTPLFDLYKKVRYAGQKKGAAKRKKDAAAKKEAAQKEAAQKDATKQDASKQDATPAPAEHTQPAPQQQPASHDASSLPAPSPAPAPAPAPSPAPAPTLVGDGSGEVVMVAARSSTPALLNGVHQ